MEDMISLFSACKRRIFAGGKQLLISLLCLFAAVSVYAQDTTVSGTVVDDTGDPIIGASVIVEGTKNGTATDLDGHFSIKVKPGAKLKVTYIGYDPVTISAKEGMKIVMNTNSVVLGGVEVVAYGVQKKVTVTGAISSVAGEDLTRTPVSSINNVLAGQLTGVTTVQTSGEPGNDAATIYVRGKGTWNNASPLVQVDGVERSLSDIDPEQIETITVLKDASATAVFGVRGANGVVLITTKRGKEGTPKIDISTSFLPQPRWLNRQTATTMLPSTTICSATTTSVMPTSSLRCSPMQSCKSLKMAATLFASQALCGLTTL
jgi:TonB-dependent SusC/RagA subfamily outer membrane receptor